MSANYYLDRALNAIKDVDRRLKRIKIEIEDDTEIRRAIRELEKAEKEIKRAKLEDNL